MERERESRKERGRKRQGVAEENFITQQNQIKSYLVRKQVKKLT